MNRTKETNCDIIILFRFSPALVEERAAGVATQFKYVGKYRNIQQSIILWDLWMLDSTIAQAGGVVVTAHG